MPKVSPAPYLYYGETTSLCETCLKLAPTKILIQGEDVFYRKRCPEHGVQTTRVASDADWFRSTREWLKPGDRPLLRQTETVRGCPWDCGLCPDHEQHSCLAIVEINDACNLACPVCFAESSPARNESRTRAEVEAMLDALVASEGEPDLVQISGGEPTIHPQIIEILQAAQARPIRHVMLNTNGVRIADDPAFVNQLAGLGPGFEVYLQFDSLHGNALTHLRGADLTGVRKRALDNLEAAGVSTSLVATVKRGVNDHEMGDIIRHGLGYQCVRGVTFQPVQDAGRNSGFSKDDRVLLTDIRRAIVAQSGMFGADDIIPLPCNPESIAIGFGLRTANGVVRAAPATVSRLDFGPIGFTDVRLLVNDVPIGTSLIGIETLQRFKSWRVAEDRLTLEY